MVGEVIAEQVDAIETRLKAALFERLLHHKTPRFAVDARGVLWINGEKAGDLRPAFAAAVREALEAAAAPAAGGEGEQ